MNKSRAAVFKNGARLFSWVFLINAGGECRRGGSAWKGLKLSLPVKPNGQQPGDGKEQRGAAKENVGGIGGNRYGFRGGRAERRNAEGGDEGGQVVFAGTPEDCVKCPESRTGQVLEEYFKTHPNQ